MANKLVSVYNIWNIPRFIAIGLLVYFANQQNIEEMEPFKQYCCDCYFVSKNPSAYSNIPIANDIRFDLSYCIPTCTDCNFCQRHFNNNAQNAFDYHGDYCPIDPSYNSHAHITFDSNWNKLTGCSDRVSITSMTFWAKSYKTYGVSAVTITAFYGFALLVVACISSCAPDIPSAAFMRSIQIYNILVSEICLYLLFKPFQFYRQELVVGDHNKHILCEINSIKDVTVEISTAVIWICIVFMFIHFVYVCVQIYMYCKRYVVSMRNDNRLRRESVTLSDNEQIVTYGTVPAVSHKRTSIPRVKKVFGALVMLLMVVFLVITMYIIAKMIHLSYKQFNGWKISWIVSTSVLSILSMFDTIAFVWCMERASKHTRDRALNMAQLTGDTDQFDYEHVSVKFTVEPQVLTQQQRPCVIYQEIRFAKPIHIEFITFRNFYCAFVSIHKYNDNHKSAADDKPEWITILSKYQLMQNGHYENDAQNSHIIHSTQFIDEHNEANSDRNANEQQREKEKTSALRFYLIQPSPNWTSFGLRDLMCYTLLRKPKQGKKLVQEAGTKKSLNYKQECDGFLAQSSAGNEWNIKEAAKLFRKLANDTEQ